MNSLEADIDIFSGKQLSYLCFDYHCSIPENFCKQKSLIWCNLILDFHNLVGDELLSSFEDKKYLLNDD